MWEEPRRTARLVPALLTATAVAAFLGACGGGEQEFTKEEAGTYEIEIERVSFPLKQTLAQEQDLTVSVVNRDDRPIPNLAITIDGFYERSSQPGMANPMVPVWVVQAQPRAGEGALTNTWTFGRLEPGERLMETWNVAPSVAGTHEVKIKVDAGLNPDVKAEQPDGMPPERRFKVDISDAVPPSHLTADGEVVREPAPAASQD
jgi:hypothetical protein